MNVKEVDQPLTALLHHKRIHNSYYNLILASSLTSPPFYGVADASFTAVSGTIIITT